MVTASITSFPLSPLLTSNLLPLSTTCNFQSSLTVQFANIQFHVTCVTIAANNILQSRKLMIRSPNLCLSGISQTNLWWAAQWTYSFPEAFRSVFLIFTHLKPFFPHYFHLFRTWYLKETFSGLTLQVWFLVYLIMLSKINFWTNQILRSYI